MITIKDAAAIKKMEITGKVLANLFKALPSLIVPGAIVLDIENYIAQYQSQHNLISCSKGYMGYRHTSCISINNTVVHGVPGSQKIKEGDMVKVDVCASLNGYCADMARCFFVGKVSKKAKELVDVAWSALNKGISQAKPGNRVGDISAAIQVEVESHGYGIVREFAGHGIGKNMHEAPEILNYGKTGTGPIIKAGMAFAIEPIITAGDYNVYIAKDGWTAKTVDGSLAAHVEDTVVITEKGPKIITRLNEKSLDYVC